jgi:hypothetical protein
MPLYVEKALKQFQHPPSIVPQNQMHQHIQKTYGAKVQPGNLPDNSQLLDKAGKKFIQEVTRVLLYLVQAVDSKMLTTLSTFDPNKPHPQKRRCKNGFNF